MEPVLYSPRAVPRGALMLTLSLSVIAKIPAAPDASGVCLDRKAHTLHSSPLIIRTRRSSFGSVYELN